MLKLISFRSAASAVLHADNWKRQFCQVAIPKNEKPSYVTQPDPVYTLPHYGAASEELDRLSDASVRAALKAYGGLMRERDGMDELRKRLRSLTNAGYRKSQLTIEGVVVSDKMNKSVVIAARRKAYSSKLQKAYLKIRRFMAHDEFDLCREGDRVVIRSCRLLSRRKSHVVVENYGDKTRPEVDNRGIVINDLIRESQKSYASAQGSE